MDKGKFDGLRVLLGEKWAAKRGVKLGKLVELLGALQGWPWRVGDADIDLAILVDKDGKDVFGDDYENEWYQDEQHAETVLLALDLMPELLTIVDLARRFHRDVNRTWHHEPVRNLDEVNEGLRLALEKLFPPESTS